MVNYQNGKIYRIVCNVTDKVYIGSTTKERLSQRLTAHVSDYKKYLVDHKKKLTSYEVLQYDDYDIVLIENCPCDTKDELLKRERYFIETLVCVNKVIPTRTVKEYYEANKETIVNQNKKYVEIHKDEIKIRMKKYGEDNKEYLDKQQKQYYIDNKELKKVKNATLITCECGKKYTYSNHARHLKSPSHTKALNNI
jgi:hypothetical protein